ncbi:MAG: FHA domain-containing protein [Bdellovibrionota bacterium]
MKAATQAAGQMRLRCLDGRIPDAFVLDRKKLLIGSADNCDIQLKLQGISSYHLFLFVKGEGVMVKDLYSEAGVFVNGKRVQESFVGAGDVLTIGNLSFAAECLEDAPPVFNPDSVIETMRVEPNAHFEVPQKEGLVFIDGEYCDIKFDESNWKPSTKIPLTIFDGDYVDLDQSLEALEIVHQTKDRRLEIISYMNGLMMDVTFLKLRDGEFFLGADKDSRTIQFHTLERTKLFSISDGKLRFQPNDQIIPSVAWEKVNLSEPLFLTHGAEQVSIRLVDHATDWRAIPLFYRDREFFIRASKVFAGVFLPMLLLLFVTIPTQEEIKESVAVVYTIKTPVQKETPESEVKSEVAAQEVTSQTENSGHKQTDQQVKPKVEFAQASAKQKVVAKATSPAPAQAAPTAPAVKAYEFKSSVALGSVTADAPNLNATGSAQGKSGMKDVSFNAGSSDKGALVAGADIGVGKFNGSDSKGNGSGSYGARGLASKKGFDSAYLEPKTVVLGSMDPELLRKILREYIPQFRHCYQQELIGHDEKIKGVIDLNFTINAVGKVSRFDIKVKDAQFSKKGVNCMGNVLGLIDFPKPKGGGVVDVRQPLNFFSETEKI